ncbi:PAS domain-containing protein [Lentibacillus cibarius]|uniref:histidine kinase n=1 Tax=Lentibacillus cibarius TaxID=2583219 RepID=A0A549YM18_9BACI|nr:ATP-binding protein [Lentibacillus cibarius]TRM12925.1 PAS domain-containing protein [Lentibacillus cibarius]
MRLRPLLGKPLAAYHAGIFILVAVTGIIISQLTEAYIILASILVVEYIILLVIMLHVNEKYIRPIWKSSRLVDELLEGNYRARIHHESGGSIGELNNKLNVLARNLSEFRMQEQMQEEQLSTVIDNTQSGLVLIDGKGYIHLVNRKFLSMFGGTPQDYRSYLYYDVLENETIHQTVQYTFLYEKNITDSFTQTIDFEKKYIDIIGAPIFDERNMLKGAVLLLYDITHLKKLEVMRKDFVANVSHELKTPITSITGFTETLLNGAMDDKETLNNFLMIIYDESSRLSNLIEDLLTLSRLEKDEFKLTRTTINFNRLINEVLPIIQQRAEQKGISLTTDVTKDITMHADGKRIKQILINLLTNAISYTPENGDVNLSITDEEENVHITVTDNGIGIDQEAIPRIFERFYRVDKARSRDTGGTGLGLAIVKHIVEVHDGKISVDSKLGEGSVFHVLLPKYDKTSP